MNFLREKGELGQFGLAKHFELEITGTLWKGRKEMLLKGKSVSAQPLYFFPGYL